MPQMQVVNSIKSEDMSFLMCNSCCFENVRKYSSIVKYFIKILFLNPAQQKVRSVLIFRSIWRHLSSVNLVSPYSRKSRNNPMVNGRVDEK